MRLSRRLLAITFGAMAVAATIPGPAGAHHSYLHFHWARTGNPFTVQLGNNLSGKWATHLKAASADWTASAVLDTAIVRGATDPALCELTPGRAEVCNARYGLTDWVGIAQLWFTASGHITGAVVKMNDSYFDQPRYDTAAWRRFVMCQEVGHAFGLDHQDVNFTNPNLGTCMDYTADPAGTAGTNGTLDNLHPNRHDFDQLLSIYRHRDQTSTVGEATTGGPGGEATAATSASWGEPTRYADDGRPVRFERVLADGQRLVTFVTRAR